MELLTNIYNFMLSNEIITIVSSNAIIVALISFLTKIQISRIDQKGKHHYDVLLLEIKNKKEKENQAIKIQFDNLAKSIDFKLSKSLHVDKTQFDFEYELYQKMWKSLVDLKRAVSDLRPIGSFQDFSGEDKQCVKIKMETFNSSFIQVQNVIEYNQPFFPEKIYEQLNAILDFSMAEFAQFLYSDRKDIKEYLENAQRNRGKIISLIGSTLETIKERFDEIKSL